MDSFLVAVVEPAVVVAPELEQLAVLAEPGVEVVADPGSVARLQPLVPLAVVVVGGPAASWLSEFAYSDLVAGSSGLVDLVSYCQLGLEHLLVASRFAEPL